VLAASGVAAVPVVVDDPGALQPPGDFRGSADYRRSLATTLTARVRTALETSEGHQ
jgi:CO/xanthine dehydrogenase FAD-binding subunit